MNMIEDGQSQSGERARATGGELAGIPNCFSNSFARSASVTSSTAWHREGLCLFWKWKSRNRKSAESRLSAEQIALIRQVAQENRLWGAERIRGELLKLGISVAKRTIQRYMRGVRPPTLPHGQNWKTFLANHTGWACDFLQVYDIWFRPLFAFFVIDIKSREVIHVGVTRAPTEQWTAQQLRNITPFGEGPQFIIRDNDNKFGAEFDRVAKGAGMKVLRTAIRAPLMNSICERFLGSVRRECLDHVIILGQRHLANVLNEYCFSYFNKFRPHQGIRQRIPSPLAPKKFTAGDTYLTDEAENKSCEPVSASFVRQVASFCRAIFLRAHPEKPDPIARVKLPKKETPKVPHLGIASQRDANPRIIVRYGGPGHAPTKGRRERRVEVFEPGLGFLRLWMRKFYPGGSLVFAGPNGGYLKAWPEKFPGWAEFAGVDRLSSHIMRHSYAVAMLSGTWGYEPRTFEFVGRQLGHSELGVTEKYYGRFESGTWQPEVEQMVGGKVARLPRKPVTAVELLGLSEVELDDYEGPPKSSLSKAGLGPLDAAVDADFEVYSKEAVNYYSSRHSPQPAADRWEG